MHGFIVFLFSLAAGITASGLVGAVYRLVASEPKSRIATVLHYGVMVFAGPVILIGNSTRSYRKKECSKAAYFLAVALGAYWSFAMGVFVLSVCVAWRGA
jgi:hypothetical protein